MAIWILTTGQYSSYEAIGVFSSLEKVEEYKAQAKIRFLKYWECCAKEEGEDTEQALSIFLSQFNDPIETEIDIKCQSENCIPYLIYMFRDGEIKDIGIATNGELFTLPTRSFPQYHNYNGEIYGQGVLRRYEINAKSEQQAVQIANDMRRELIALNQI
jgi:hypothetical protein